MKVQDLPNNVPPVMVEDSERRTLYGRLTSNWFGWFITLVKAVQEAQASAIISFQDTRTFAGPGPVTTSLQVSTIRDCVLCINFNVVQSFVTAAPAWALHIIVDGVDSNTGTVTSWQSVASFSANIPVAKGLHTVQFQWVASTTNGSVIARSGTITPTYS